MCLEAAYIGKDFLAVLPTGYGKSVIFHLLPSLLAEKKKRAGIRGKDPIKLPYTRSTAKDKRCSY